MPTGAVMPPPVWLAMAVPVLVNALTLLLLVPLFATQAFPKLSKEMLFGVLRPLPVICVPLDPSLLNFVMLGVPLLLAFATQALPLASVAT